MISVQTANKYYESLRFNHYESGGTCEQRILVLRVRFDSFLKEAIQSKNNENDFYVEKLQSLYSQFPKVFSKKDEDEFDVLRRFLNGVQHSKYDSVSENDYTLSLKRLCTLISKSSGEAIPELLQKLWDKSLHDPCNPKVSINETASLLSDVNKTSITNIKSSKGGIIPVSILLDTSNIATSAESTKAFNELLHNFIEELYSYDLPIKFTLIFLEKNGVKTVSPFTGTKHFVSIDKIGEENMMAYAIEELITNLTLSQDEILGQSTKGICALLFGSKTSCLLPSGKQFAEFVESNNIAVFPIGVDSSIDKEKIKTLYPKRETVIMTEGKFPEFLSWLIECIKITCES